MEDNRIEHPVHLPGTLSADAQGVIPAHTNTGILLLEVAATASNDSDATLMIGLDDDEDGIMTAKAIGDSGTPRIFKVADFNGVLADPIRTSNPQLEPQQHFTWKLNFNGAGPNEVQTVTITGVPTGGSFTLTYAGQTTAAIAFNATAAAVASALKALSNIGDADVAVTGAAGGPYTVTFMGALAETNVAQMTASGASLTGGTTPGVTVATQTAGGPLTAAQNVDLRFTLIVGGVHSHVSGF